MRRQALTTAALGAAIFLGSAFPSRAQMPPAGGMPNLAAVNGRPLPDRGMAVGTVSVRVVRKMPSNPVANVEATALVKNAGGDMRKRTARTDAEGRALFEGMSAGDEFRVEVTVDGEKVASQLFTIPAEGGLRTMLIAGLDKSAGQGGGGDLGGAGDAESFTLGVTAGSAVPDENLPARTFELRLFDEQGNPIANHAVLLGMVGKDNKVEVRRGRSDAAGTARFDGLPVGPETGYAAIIEHKGLRLGTAPFAMPETGGARGEIRALARTSDPSVITIGPGGRVVVQLREDNLQFLEMLPLENRSDKMFDPGPGAIEIPLPQGFVAAQGAQESERKIEVRQNHGVAVHGPVVPKRALVGGETGRDARRSGQEVAFGFVLPYSGSEKDFEQPMPNGMGPFTLITDQIPGLTVTGPGIGAREARELGGRKYWVMPVEGIQPGGTLRFTLEGLPAIDNTGQIVAGVLALGLVFGAIVFARPARKDGRGKKSAGGQRTRDDERARLVKAREALFGELVALETAVKASGAPRQTEDRKQLVAKLEQVYRELASLDEQRAA
jgi:hypothetical protein